MYMNRLLTITFAFVLGLPCVAKTNAFRIDGRKDVTITLPQESKPVLQTTAELLGHDLRSVFGDTLREVRKNADISVRIDPAAVAEPQGFRMTVDKKERLEITGHDSHGAAYGLIELTRLIGVSPWEWWADAAPAKKESFELPVGYLNEQAPDIPYRGIFINDEDWGLNPWAYKTFEPSDVKGEIGPKTNAKIFELMLRLRANYYWPAMHECTQPFFLTPGNREAAAKYGIYIGGSHCEPMASSTAVEWGRRGVGEYDYVNNSANVLKFWEDRVKDVAGQEIVYTLGMRGVHDGAMNGAKTVEEQKNVLSKAIADQRGLIARYVNPDVTKVPQVFIPYKEVLDVYNTGLEVPDDVTLMWCDDNYGYIRHFPTEKERARNGGNGVYYHVSYWGRPHDYLWLGTASPYLLHQQMSEAYKRGIRKMWILNVGDIKPVEYQTELFLDMAWDIERVNEQGVTNHLSDFLSREFGNETAMQLTPVMKEHYRLSFIRRPEFMGNTRVEEWGNAYFDTIRDLPWSDKYVEQRISDYQRLYDAVEALRPDNEETYFQLVKYPVQAAAEMNKKLLYAQLSRHGQPLWTKSQRAFDSIQSLTARYNTPKWNGIMSSHPRDLAVFNPVDTTCRSIEPNYPKCFHVLTSVECENQNLSIFEGLGHSGSAAQLPKGESAKFSMPEKKVDIEICFLPTHPISLSQGLNVEVLVDGKSFGMIDYHTEGRSEQWKQNILRNQAIVKLKDIKGKEISIKALSEGIILDQINLYEQTK